MKPILIGLLGFDQNSPVPRLIETVPHKGGRRLKKEKGKKWNKKRREVFKLPASI